MIDRIRSTLARLAAVGAVKRRGVGALEAYGGEVRGRGHVIHKSGDRAGTRTDFNLEGRPASRN